MRETIRTEEQRLSPEAVEALSWVKDEPEWMRQRRREAWRIYESIPMPKPTDEEWRRTDISGLKLDRVVPFVVDGASVAGRRELPQDLRRALGRMEAVGLLVQRNSYSVYRQLDPELEERGVIFTSLEVAVREHPELVQRYLLERALPPGYGKFAALHAALWSGGAFLYVPRGVEIEAPLRVHTWMDIPGTGIFPHTLLVLEPGAKAVLFDEYVSPTLEGQNFASAGVEIYLEQGAQLTYAQLQDWGRNTFHFIAQRALLERDAHIQWIVGTMGAKLSKANVESILRGPGARADMLGLFFADSNQLFDHHTLQDHIAPHTTSDLLYKGCLTGRSRSVFSGLIRVHQGAQRTDAYQANRNLILSDKARADSIPNLEIGANDVRCTHGATVGQIDQEQLFYLQSRGLSRGEAERLIVDGFFEPVVQRIPLPEARQKLLSLVDRKMSDGRG